MNVNIDKNIANNRWMTQELCGLFTVAFKHGQALTPSRDVSHMLSS